MVCDNNMCVGCMACVNICPNDAIVIDKQANAYNAIIDNEKCVKCGLCSKVCQQNKKEALRAPISWYEGWAKESIRQKSSSGGFGTALLAHFASTGGAVCSCVFVDGNFSYKICRNSSQIESYKGSKYVKSDPGYIYRELKKLLDSGERVLFLGLPCHVAGLKEYLRKEYDTLFTVDLICHGTPAPILFQSFMNDYHFKTNGLSEVQFRVKNCFSIRNGDRPVVLEGVRDRYTMAFLSGLTYTENCYKCQFAAINRVSDITLGDSWGTEKLNQVEKGISLALCMTAKGEELLKSSGVSLYDVDLDKAIDANRQLKSPSSAPAGREQFFKAFERHKSFSKAFRVACPRQYYRQNLKALLIKLRILKNK